MSGNPHAVNVALVSGGMDSTTACAVANERVDLDLMAYLDTGTGLQENREYVEELADHLGLQLWTLRTHESYEDRVKENSFPGPSRHQMMYSILKERQIRTLATICNGRGNSNNLNLFSGVRSDESERRMKHVSEEQEGARWTWRAPIHDWTKQECREYVADNDLPHNDLWDTLGRSGDCFCGCFGSPEEKLDLRAAECGYHADWINNLEEQVDADDEKGRWAWGSMSDPERRAERADQDNDQMLLCSTCGFSPEDLQPEGDT
jgi:3'-phosphoadenosine 5'-phosphosulfate sulfotransferase (PAPS reductase)/FAD synthetase